MIKLSCRKQVKLNTVAVINLMKYRDKFTFTSFCTNTWTASDSTCQSIKVNAYDPFRSSSWSIPSFLQNSTVQKACINEEYLILPVAIDMATKCWESTASQLLSILVSNDTVSCQIPDRAKNSYKHLINKLNKPSVIQIEVRVLKTLTNVHKIWR